MGVDQMFQDHGFRVLRNPYELREFPVRDPGMSFRDVSRPRACGVADLLAELEVAPEFRAAKEQLDAEVHLMGELPGVEFPEVLGGGHAADSCNRMACELSVKSGLS